MLRPRLRSISIPQPMREPLQHPVSSASALLKRVAEGLHPAVQVSTPPPLVRSTVESFDCSPQRQSAFIHLTQSPGSTERGILAIYFGGPHDHS